MWHSKSSWAGSALTCVEESAVINSSPVPLTTSPMRPSVKVVGLLDGRTPGVGAEALSRPDTFQKAVDDSQGRLEAEFVIARGGVTDHLRRYGHTATGALLLTTGIVGLTAGLSLAALPLSLVAASGLIVLRPGFRRLAGLAKKMGQRLTGTESSHKVSSEFSRKPDSVLFGQKLQKSKERSPDVLHVAFVSGHGDVESAAGVPFAELAQAVAKADVVALESCCSAQLETLSHLSHSSAVVVASQHSIFAGLPLAALLDPEQPARDKRQLGAAIVEQPRLLSSRSLTALDMDGMRTALLPSLSKLGTQLSNEVSTADGREKIVAALKKSYSPDMLGGSRVDLDSFLHRLREAECCPELALKASEALATSTVARRGKGGLSFDLVAGREHSELPAGWRDFLKALDLDRKP